MQNPTSGMIMAYFYPFENKAEIQDQIWLKNDYLMFDFETFFNLIIVQYDLS